MLLSMQRFRVFTGSSEKQVSILVVMLSNQNRNDPVNNATTVNYCHCIAFNRLLVESAT